MKFREYLYGIVATILNAFVPGKPKLWVFVADQGNTYREGSKYLLEYMLKNHPDFDCIFITKNPEVESELNMKGVPVANNYSIRGLFKIASADCVFVTQTLTDIKYSFKRKDKALFFLVHGQPFKKALKMLSEQDKERLFSLHERSNYTLFKEKILKKLYWSYDDISFVSATSEFTARLQRNEFPSNVGVRILGMPRNDALFDDERMKTEKWDSSFQNKYVVTYMPTHRKYGRGEVSQTPFLHRDDIQQWMREHNVLLLVKQHPNMVYKLLELEETDVIKNISKAGYDPQVVIYHSDVLITDYSSVWMDYLLLRRPLVFYFYDNFEEEDAGCYYNLRDEFPNNWCDTEDGLFSMIKRAFENSSDLVPSDTEVKKFHRYSDDKSCERYYNEIVEMRYGKK